MAAEYNKSFFKGIQGRSLFNSSHGLFVPPSIRKFLEKNSWFIMLSLTF